MNLIKIVERQVPFKSGCDDEIEESELRMALEDLSEMHAASLNTTATLTASAAAARDKDKEDAETARRSAMGELTRDEMKRLKPGGKRRGQNKHETPNKRLSLRTVSPAL
jgi:hypothetical protein